MFCSPLAVTAFAQLIASLALLATARPSLAAPRQGSAPQGPVDEWGHNPAGQDLTPPIDLGECTAIAFGGRHGLAVTASGTVRAWGANDTSQATVPANLGACTQVAGGWAHSLALTTGGAVRAWGSTTGGNLTVPVLAQSGVARISTRVFHSAALKTDGSVQVWGLNTNGQS